MNHNLNGLANINIELTSRCNKNCWICGRRRIEREYPELTLKYGDMEFPLVEKIAQQLPPNVVVQLHNNGEGLLYPRFGEALKLFQNQITNIVTNGKLLLEKADEIIGRLDTLAVSIIEKDPEADEQFEIIKSFLKLKRDRKPYTVLRINGEVNLERYEKLNLLLVKRALHSALGSFNYRKTSPTIPEIGICLDFLHHLAVNKDGMVSICVRFDPKGLGIIGDARIQSLEEFWNSPLRLEWLTRHKEGRRDLIPLCAYCHFWGVPTSASYETSKNIIDESSVFKK
ncbi:MAG: radical SAM/SPASM domain-containing protein [Pseudomonadota bacterium]